MSNTEQEELRDLVVKEVSIQEEKLKALQRAYLTHRQVGFSEAVYRAIKSMWLKGSNVTCVLVSSGFPENRYVSFKKVGFRDIKRAFGQDFNVLSENGSDFVSQRRW